MMQGMTTFPTIDPRGLFGKPRPDGGPGIGTFLHSSIEAYHAKQRREEQRKAILRGRTDFRKLTSPEIDRLLKLLNKRTRGYTSSRDRTTSFRKRAGSRKGNGRRTTLKDRGWEIDWDAYGRTTYDCPYVTVCLRHDH